MSQTSRLADQIRRSYYGEAWHGDSIEEILTGVNAEMAAAHPLKNAHSIWELVLHIAAWDDAVRRRTAGQDQELVATRYAFRDSRRLAACSCSFHHSAAR